jgi:hypothetical protein
MQNWYKNPPLKSFQNASKCFQEKCMHKQIHIYIKNLNECNVTLMYKEKYITLFTMLDKMLKNLS